MEYLYLIRCDDLIKIGIASDVNNRLKTLQTGNPYPLTLIDYFEFDDAVRVESILHRKYDHARVRGEWFKLTDTELDELIDLCRNLDESKIVFRGDSMAARVLQSALSYCAEAGIQVDIYNEDGKLILIVHGVEYSREDEAIRVLPQAVTP